MKNLSTEIPVPLPQDWALIHHEMMKLRDADTIIPEPPVPLILAGAAFSTSSQIRARWISLIEWANQYGFAEDLEKTIPPEPEFDVAEKIAGVSENTNKHWWDSLSDENDE